LWFSVIAIFLRSSRKLAFSLHYYFFNILAVLAEGFLLIIPNKLLYKTLAETPSAKVFFEHPLVRQVRMGLLKFSFSLNPPPHDTRALVGKDGHSRFTFVI